MIYLQEISAKTRLEEELSREKALVSHVQEELKQEKEVLSRVQEELEASRAAANQEAKGKEETDRLEERLKEVEQSRKEMEKVSN